MTFCVSAMNVSVKYFYSGHAGKRSAAHTNCTVNEPFPVARATEYANAVLRQWCSNHKNGL